MSVTNLTKATLIGDSTRSTVGAARCRDRRPVIDRGIAADSLTDLLQSGPLFIANRSRVQRWRAPVFTPRLHGHFFLSFGVCHRDIGFVSRYVLYYFTR